jgi:tropinone reductase I
MKKWTLENKKALITGASKGIGYAIAEEFLELGAEVVIVARDPEGLDKAVNDLKSKGYPIEGIAADVTNSSDRLKIIELISTKWGKLDILVNNAGTNIRKQLVDYSEDEYRFIFEINLFSVVEMCRLCYPFLLKGQGANVVNVASVAGSVDVQSGAPYGMTKAAEIQLTRHLAAEWAPHTIRVNAISPWYTKTPLTEPVFNQPERLERIIARTPLSRVAEAEEMASVVAFLAMEKASYITGQNINVDGGMTIKGL